jgi:hypothetical protein
MAEIYDKSGEKILILGTRQSLLYPFDAPDWLDLRVGFFLSITDDTADDTITGLSETISAPVGGMQPQDRYWIGVKDRVQLLPHQSGTVFAGFSNSSPSREFGDSRVSTSDAGIGTTNANFWRPNNSSNPNQSGIIWDGLTYRAFTPDGCQQHFAQDATGAGGYATLLGLRLQRDSVLSNTITVQIPTSTHSGDMLFTNTPTTDLLLSSLEGWPGAVKQLGPVSLTTMPDALMLYWPFFLSRLRIHAVGVLKAR